MKCTIYFCMVHCTYGNTTPYAYIYTCITSHQIMSYNLIYNIPQSHNLTTWQNNEKDTTSLINLPTGQLSSLTLSGWLSANVGSGEAHATLPLCFDSGEEGSVTHVGFSEMLEQRIKKQGYNFSPMLTISVSVFQRVWEWEREREREREGRGTKSNN